VAGHTGELRSRSLLTSHEDAVTLIFKGVPGVEIRTPSYVWAYLKKGLSDEVLCLLPPSLPLSPPGWSAPLSLHVETIERLLSR